MGVKNRGNFVPDLRNEAGEAASTAGRVFSDLDIDPEILLDVPVQARALAKLSLRELARYRRARRLLTEGSVQAIPQAGMCLSGRGVYEALLAHSWSVRFDNPDEMVRLAEIALDVSRTFASRIRAKLVNDLQARAWGELANAYRAADRLRSSQTAFGEAYALLQRGTGDPFLKARLFDLEASLLGTLREFPMALHRLSSLANLYLDLGETHLAGRALITSALYTFYDGAAEEAITINQRGTSLIDQSKDPTLFMHSLHNHLLFLVDLKLYPKALRLLFENRRHLIYKDRISALRLRGIEGRINYGMGSLLSAEIVFREVKEGFSAVGMSFHTAILALELAMVLQSLERTDEALQEVIAAREIFLAYEIYREYLGSVIFLEESFRRGEATTELIEATVAQINRKWLQIGPRQMR
ncbi:MAG: hypothetical protein ACJ76N_23100 [Thermoanaerobaculia bacterium]